MKIGEFRTWVFGKGDSMDGTVLVGIFSALASIIGSFGGIIVASKLTNYRLEQLEKKVEKHNNLIERTYILEGKQKETERRVEYLEKNQKGGSKL